MKSIGPKEAFIGVAISLVFVIVVVQLALSLDAVKQRKASTRQRNEIICILKIQPEARTAQQFDACRG